MPPSTARRTIGAASVSSSAHGRPSSLPKLIIPRHTRETRRPVAPRFTYSIDSSLTASLRPVEGKHVVVTGAGRGIGKAIALRLARDGARLSLLARGADALYETADEIGRAFVRQVDIRDAGRVDAAFAAAARASRPTSGRCWRCRRGA